MSESPKSQSTKQQPDDPHAWLRTADWTAVLHDSSCLESQIRKHLEAENERLEKTLAPVRGLRKELMREMRTRIQEADSTPPSPDGPWAYYARFIEGGEHPILCRCVTDHDDSEQVLLDGNQEAKESAFFRIAGTHHAPGHHLFAYATDRNGSERYEIRIRDLKTGEDLKECIGDAQGDFAWSLDSKRLFYTTLDKRHRPWRVMCHNVGESAEQDECVFQNDSPEIFIGVSSTESGRFVCIDAHEHSDTSEIRLIDASRPGTPNLVLPRREGIRYTVADRGEDLFLLTNADGAVDFQIVRLPREGASSAFPEVVVPHQEGRLILSMLVFQNWLVRLERKDAQPRIVVREIDTGEEHEVDPGTEIDPGAEKVRSLQLVPGYEFKTDKLRLVYSSMTTPERTFDYGMPDRTLSLIKKQKIPGGHNPDEYTTKRLRVRADDGEEIPVSLLHRKDTKLDGTNPLLLYGYGAYGYAVPTAFSSRRLSLVDRGFVYAIAHVRGGTDRGWHWYLNGKLEHKENTFDDFVAVAHHLTSEGFCAPGRIVAHGGSAGGLLMGASVNKAPTAFGGIIAEVPFVDVLNTILDETLPLTPPEWSEWGNPILNEEAFQRIASWCPYSNVTAKPYPPILATAGLTDPRVGYWEPAKWVARIAEMTTGKIAPLLWTNLEAGHGGSAGRFERLDEVALVYAFALMVTGKASG